MSETLHFSNYQPVNIKEVSGLAVDIEPTDTSLTLFNNDNIVADDYLLVGRAGDEQSEIKQVDSASGVQVVVTNAIGFTHAYNTPVTALNYNQLKIYRASNVNGTQPADGSFSLLDTVDIDPDQIETTYVDETGGSGYWYKSTYYNSTATTESSIAEAIAIRGGNAGYYTTVEAVKKEAGFEFNRNITWMNVFVQLLAAQSYINGSLSGVYTIPFSTPYNAFIVKLTTVLAAGYLLNEQFSSFVSSKDINGDTKVKWVEAQLSALKSGQLTLTNPDGSQPDVVPSTTTDRGFSGWPNATTADAGYGDFKFRVTDTDGYNSRQY